MVSNFLHLSSPQHNAIDGLDPLIDRFHQRNLLEQLLLFAVALALCGFRESALFADQSRGYWRRNNFRHLESYPRGIYFRISAIDNVIPRNPSPPTLLRCLDNKRIPDT